MEWFVIVALGAFLLAWVLIVREASRDRPSNVIDHPKSEARTEHTQKACLNQMATSG